MSASPEIARANGKKGGRPKGSTTRPQIMDYINEDDIKLLVSQIISKVKEGDSKILSWLGDQAFGRALQTTELTGKDGKDLNFTVTGMNIIKENDTARKNNRVQDKESKATASS